MFIIRPHTVLFLSFVLLFGSSPLFAQDGAEDRAKDSLSYCSTIVLEGDTIPEVRMAVVEVDDRKERESRAYQRKYERLKPKVIEVYPYAEVAGLLLEHYEAKMQGIELEARQKLYMKKVENDLKAEFKDEITELTISEGRILMKLIDRETGTTSFRIIEELRGSFSAHFWQGVARVFGHDLKADYDPVDDEKVIEDIVLDIRSGELEIPEREPNSDKVKQLLKDDGDIGRWWVLKG